jgi:tetratricopeptide (TPR) repeat protein
LSYASEDTAAARRLCEALRAAGIEVWFDQSELRGGDAWDAAIRRQIKTCSLFIPIISKSSHSRAEGYFRLEWKLAIDRSHLIAPHLPFLLPIVIDGTAEIDDRLPERFRDVQWIRAPEGEPPAGFAQHVAELLARTPRAEGAAAPSAPRSLHSAATPAPATPRRRAMLAWLAGAIVVAALIGVAWMRYFSHPAAVAAYSLADRRMTFAVLPFHAPVDDEHGARVAKATADVVIGNLESASIWCQTAPRARVDAAVAKFTGARELAEALDVHFLIRGTLQPERDGYTLNLALINGATEQTLLTAALPVPKGELKPVFDDDVDTAVYHLVLAGMHEEVQRAQDRPADALDVRDLSFRAFDYWRHHRGKEAKEGYFSASELLNRALKLAPDDPLATYLTADINLCDCVMGWSLNPDEQRAIGTAALEKYLRGHPTDPEMLLDKAGILQLRGRYDEAQVVADSVLQRHPDHSGALATQVITLVHLDRAREAIPLADELASRFPDKWEDLTALAADAHYAVGDYAAASTLAANAAARSDETNLKSPIFGEVRLTLAAAEAQIGHADRARRALEDFYAAVPAVRSITALRKWIYPTDPLANFEPLYAGLKLAGMPE